MYYLAACKKGEAVQRLAATGEERNIPHGHYQSKEKVRTYMTTFARVQQQQQQQHDGRPQSAPRGGVNKSGGNARYYYEVPSAGTEMDFQEAIAEGAPYVRPQTGAAMKGILRDGMKDPDDKKQPFRAGAPQRPQSANTRGDNNNNNTYSNSGLAGARPHQSLKATLGTVPRQYENPSKKTDQQARKVLVENVTKRLAGRADGALPLNERVNKFLGEHGDTPQMVAMRTLETGGETPLHVPKTNKKLPAYLLEARKAREDKEQKIKKNGGGGGDGAAGGGGSGGLMMMSEANPTMPSPRPRKVCRGNTSIAGRGIESGFVENLREKMHRTTGGGNARKKASDEKRTHHSPPRVQKGRGQAVAARNKNSEGGSASAPSPTAVGGAAVAVNYIPDAPPPAATADDPDDFRKSGTIKATRCGLCEMEFAVDLPARISFKSVFALRERWDKARQEQQENIKNSAQRKNNNSRNTSSPNPFDFIGTGGNKGRGVSPISNTSSAAGAGVARNQKDTPNDVAAPPYPRGQKPLNAHNSTAAPASQLYRSVKICRFCSQFFGVYLGERYEGGMEHSLGDGLFKTTTLHSSSSRFEGERGPMFTILDGDDDNDDPDGYHRGRRNERKNNKTKTADERCRSSSHSSGRRSASSSSSDDGYSDDDYESPTSPPPQGKPTRIMSGGQAAGSPEKRVTKHHERSETPEDHHAKRRSISRNSYDSTSDSESGSVTRRSRGSRTASRASHNKRRYSSSSSSSSYRSRHSSSSSSARRYSSSANSSAAGSPGRVNASRDKKSSPKKKGKSTTLTAGVNPSPVPAKPYQAPGSTALYSKQTRVPLHQRKNTKTLAERKDAAAPIAGAPAKRSYYVVPDDAVIGDDDDHDGSKTAEKKSNRNKIHSPYDAQHNLDLDAALKVRRAERKEAEKKLRKGGGKTSAKPRYGRSSGISERKKRDEMAKASAARSQIISDRQAEEQKATAPEVRVYGSKTLVIVAPSPISSYVELPALVGSAVSDTVQSLQAISAADKEWRRRNQNQQQNENDGDLEALSEAQALFPFSSASPDSTSVLAGANATKANVLKWIKKVHLESRELQDQFEAQQQQHQQGHHQLEEGEEEQKPIPIIWRHIVFIGYCSRLRGTQGIGDVGLVLSQPPSSKKRSTTSSSTTSDFALKELMELCPYSSIFLDCAVPVAYAMPPLAKSIVFTPAASGSSGSSHMEFGSLFKELVSTASTTLSSSSSAFSSFKRSLYWLITGADPAKEKKEKTGGREQNNSSSTLLWSDLLTENHDQLFSIRRPYNLGETVSWCLLPFGGDERGQQRQQRNHEKKISPAIDFLSSLIEEKPTLWKLASSICQGGTDSDNHDEKKKEIEGRCEDISLLSTHPAADPLHLVSDEEDDDDDRHTFLLGGALTLPSPYISWSRIESAFSEFVRGRVAEQCLIACAPDDDKNSSDVVSVAVVESDDHSGAKTTRVYSSLAFSSCELPFTIAVRVTSRTTPHNARTFVGEKILKPLQERLKKELQQDSQQQILVRSLGGISCSVGKPKDLLADRDLLSGASNPGEEYPFTFVSRDSIESERDGKSVRYSGGGDLINDCEINTVGLQLVLDNKEEDVSPPASDPLKRSSTTTTTITATAAATAPVTSNQGTIGGGNYDDEFENDDTDSEY